MGRCEHGPVDPRPRDPGTGCPVCATFIYGLLIGFPALVAIIAVLITLLRD